MVGMSLLHKLSGIIGTVDAEAIHPDAAVMVRIRDMWFDARSLVPAR